MSLFFLYLFLLPSRVGRFFVCLWFLISDSFLPELFIFFSNSAHLTGYFMTSRFVPFLTFSVLKISNLAPLFAFLISLLLLFPLSLSQWWPFWTNKFCSPFLENKIVHQCPPRPVEPPPCIQRCKDQVWWEMTIGT